MRVEFNISTGQFEAVVDDFTMRDYHPLEVSLLQPGQGFLFDGDAYTVKTKRMYGTEHGTSASVTVTSTEGAAWTFVDPNTKVFAADHVDLNHVDPSSFT
jgi:hypothetical protein